MDKEREDAFYNRSLERALQILNAFTGDKQDLAPAQLSEMLGLPRATVLRLCSTLVKYDFLRQEPESKRYSLGLRLFELGSIVLNSFSLRKIASRHLADLRRRIGKTVFLGVLDNEELLYIDKREDSRNPIRFTSEIGKRRPPYWGMAGPLLMAYLPEGEAYDLLERYPLKVTAKKSITDKDEFVRWLRQIREQGFVVDLETALDGIAGVAAPVRDAGGKVIAAVGVAFIASSVDSKGIKKIVKEAQATALDISRELGYMNRLAQPHNDAPQSISPLI